MGLAVWAGVAATLTLASFVQALSGFGFALCAMPLLAALIDPSDAVAVSSLVGFGASGLLVARLHAQVSWALAAPLLAGAAAGMPLGLAALLLVDGRTLRLAVAAVVLCLVGVLARGWRIGRAGRGVELAAGFVSGVLATSTSTNGPPLVLALQARAVDPETFRATIAALLFVSSVAANALLAGAGAWRGPVLGYAALGAPAVALGSAAGAAVAPWVTPARFRPLVLALLVAGAAASAAGALL